MAADDAALSALMKRYQEGDEEAFTQLYGQTATAIERYLTRWVGAQRAADLLQETFLQIHRARRTFRPELPLRPWLYAIARHVAQQALRTSSRQPVEIEFDAAAEVAAGIDAERGAALHEIERAIHDLPAAQREVVWLADVEGFTSTEIARLTGSTEGAVRVRLHRAHQKLKESLGGSSPRLESAR